MPKELEANLKIEALKKFRSSTTPRARAYIYGTMRKTGWRPKKQQGPDGR